MKRKLFALMLILCLVAGLALTVYAAPPHLADGAGLLTDTDVANLEGKLTRISDQYNVDIVIVTVASTDGKSPKDFADDYYDYNGYGADGILLLVSMEDSDWWVSTTGYGITAITDAGLEYISDRFVPHLSSGEFAEAFHGFADLCDEFLAQAQTGDPYDNHNLPKDPFRFGKNLIIALIIGLVAAWIATGSMKAKLKTVHQQVKADDYMVSDSLKLTQSRDLFLYTNLDRREKTSSGSDSSTRASSSGHGGGGGKF